MAATARAGMMGQAPTVRVDPLPKQVTVTGDQVRQLLGLSDEQVKYLKCWDHPDYRKYSPGEQMVGLFLQTIHEQPIKMKPNPPTVIDWGCGSGRGGHQIWQQGFDVTLIDFAANCLDAQVADDLDKCFEEGSGKLRFLEHDLSKPIMQRSDYGFCCDVLEHIPPEQIDQVLRTILENSLHVFFQISTVEDHFSKVIDGVDHLHLTVKPYGWWLKKFADFGCIVHHSNEHPNSVIFYVTGHKTFIFNRGSVNTAPEKVKEHMRENAKLGIPQLQPHDPQEDLEIMLLCGGPSLNDYWPEIEEQRAQGMPLVTVNGVYNQVIERGLKPSLQFVIDARPFNARFVEPAPGLTDETKYVVASQCHPDLVRKCPTDRTLLWQVTIEDEYLPLISELWGEIYKDWFPVPGGSTVTLRALCALQMMGFRKIHIYGFDSCIIDDNHHAYAQAENDKAAECELRVGKGTKYDRLFRCQGWMAIQAKEFMHLAGVYFNDLQLDVKGDGLIAHMIQSGADLADEKEG